MDTKLSLAAGPRPDELGGDAAPDPSPEAAAASLAAATVWVAPWTTTWDDEGYEELREAQALSRATEGRVVDVAATLRVKGVGG